MTRFVPQSRARAHAGFSENDVYALLAEENPAADWTAWKCRSSPGTCVRRKTPGASRIQLVGCKPTSHGKYVGRPSHILERRAGSRPYLLHSLLRHEGFTPHIALSRPERTATVDSDTWPDPRGLSRGAGARARVWLYRHAFFQLPPGHAVPALSGAKALNLSGKREIAPLDPPGRKAARWKFMPALRAEPQRIHIPARNRARFFLPCRKLSRWKAYRTRPCRSASRRNLFIKRFPEHGSKASNGSASLPRETILSCTCGFEALP